MYSVKSHRSLVLIMVIGLLLLLGLLLSGCESGDIGSGGDDVVNSTVSNLQELETALNSAEIPMVELASDFSGTGTATINNRNTDLILNLSDRTDIGVDLSISQPGNSTAWTFTLTSGTLTGNFTVDDPAVTVNNDAAVTGTTNINNVAANCFNNRESGSLNDTNVADTDGGSLLNLGSIQGDIHISGNTDPAAGNENPFLFAGGFQLPENKAFHVTNNAWIRFMNRQEEETTLGSTPINIAGGDQNQIESEDSGLVQRLQTALDAGNNISVPPVRIVSLEAPTFSPSPADGPFVIIQHVEITGPADAAVYYTTDNTLPTESSAEYTGTPIEVNSTMVIRARAYKDNTVSNVSSARYIVNLDTTAPVVNSIARAGTDPTNAGSVDYLVTFSENVTGVDSEDFTLATTGEITGASVTAVSGNGTSYTVTVNTGSGSGTINLALVDDDSIVDIADNPLGGPGDRNGDLTNGEDYTIDKTAPVVTSIVRTGDTPINTSTAEFTVTFSENVSGVAIDDFNLTTTGEITGTSVSTVSGSGADYTVSVDTGTGSGTVRLDLLDNDSIMDMAENLLGGTGTGSGDFTSGQAYTIDRTAAVSGSVTAPDGNLSDITVVLADFPTERPSSIADLIIVGNTAADGTDGSYQFTDIPYGEYLLYAYRDDDGSMDLTISPEGDPLEPVAIYGVLDETSDPLPLLVDSESVTFLELNLITPQLATVSGSLDYTDYTDVTLALLGNQSLDELDSFSNVDIRYQTSDFGPGGSYSLEYVLYGQYLLVAYDDEDGDGELDFINNSPAEPVGVYGGTMNPQPLIVDQPSITGKDFFIESFADISGQISYPELGDLSTIEIGLFFADDPDNITSADQLELVYPGTVDATGAFTITRAAYGNYMLIAYYDKNNNYTLDFGTEGPVEPVYIQPLIVDSNSITGLQAALTLPTATAVTGSVTAPDGDLSDITVVLADFPTEMPSSIADLIVVGNTAADGTNGSYQFTDIPYGEYLLYAYRDDDGSMDLTVSPEGDPLEPMGIYGVLDETSDPLPLLVDSNSTTADSFSLFVNSDAPSISGQINYHDLSHIHALLLDNDSLTDVQSYEDLIIVDETIVGEADGSYEFYNVPPGDYLVLAFRNEFINEELDFYSGGFAEPYGVSDQITVQSTAVQVNLITLTPVDFGGATASIGGQVFADDLTDVKVVLSANSPDDTIASFADFIIIDQIPVDPEYGSFLFADIPYGQYILFAFQDLNANNELDFVGGEMTEPGGVYGVLNEPQLLTVLEPSITGKTITIQSMSASISGQISSVIADLSEIEVVLLDNRDLSFSSAAEMEIAHQVSADISGYYEFTDVGYGQYLLIAYHDQNNNGALDFADGNPSENMAAYGGTPPSSLSVLSSSITAIDFSLESPTATYGATVFVMGQDGSSITDATVKAYTGEGGYIGEATTNSMLNGAAIINNLAEGDYYFEISHADYLTTLTPMYTVSAEMADPYSDTIMVNTMLFSTETIKGVFGISSINDTGGYVLSMIIADQDGDGIISAEESLDQESIVFTPDGGGNIGYMPSDSQTLDYTMTAFESPVNVIDGETTVYMAGAKDIAAGTYWMGLDPEGVDSRGNYARVENGKLTFILVTPPPLEDQAY